MKIGLAISGGGYRATTYSLGVFSYLNHLKLKDKPLLQHVEALSTVSGGSITGITYARSVKKGQSFKDYFNHLYQFVTEEDLVESSINYLTNDKNKNSLIEGFASTYTKKLFEGDTFNSIIPKYKDGAIDSHIKYNCINSTEFATGNSFRFIAKSPALEYDPKIGNYFYEIDKNKVGDIPLGVPLAASSCFPGGFEPISIHVNKYSNESEVKSLALMDGGIVDNQGITSLLNYHDFSVVKELENETTKIIYPNKLDLIMAIDVSSPSFEEFEWVNKKDLPFFGNVKFITICNWLTILNILFIAGIIFSYNDIQLLLFTAVSSLLTFFSVVLISGRFLAKSLLKNSEIGYGKIKPLNSLTPNLILELLQNRFSSVALLVQTVFMKQLRKNNLSLLFSKSQYRNISIHNAIYQLKSPTVDDVKQKMGFLHLKEEFKQPTDKMRSICTNAFSMGTTLWVANNAKGKQLVKDVIVAGQITTCANLMKHYSSVTKTETIDSGTDDELIFKHAKRDWEKFRTNPYWLFDELYKTKKSN